MPAGNLAGARFGHTSTLLANGKVLIAGGRLTSGALTSAEIYDPIGGTITSAGNMTQPRLAATATPLPNGKVLIAGGFLGGNTAELFDPVAGTFTATGNMTFQRSQGTATLLRNGKVLVTGSVQPAELYDPAAGTFVQTGNMNVTRLGHTAALLPDGKVLIAGGYDLGIAGATGAAEIYDPANGTFQTTGSGSARLYATSTVLPDGNVLITGGTSGSSELISAEIYDRALGTFRTLTSTMSVARQRHTATLLTNGKVLISGGLSPSSTATADLYNPADETFTATAVMSSPRDAHAATLLMTGEVLMTGGRNGTNALTSAEVYRPSIGRFVASTTTLPISRYFATMTLLPNGKVLVAGGNPALDRCDLYDPAADTFTQTGSLITGRREHTATLLTDGTVLIAGGAVQFAPGYLASAEVYDPSTGTFHATGSMTLRRAGHTATLLRDGRVMIYGGFANNPQDPGYVKGVDIYDPVSGTFSMVNVDFDFGREGHTATLMSNGSVLIAGGGQNGQAGTPSFVFDGSTGTYLNGAGTTRRYHSATLLRSGKVLVAGGFISNNTTVNTAELFDPATNTFSATGNLNSAGVQTATLLSSGKVLMQNPASSELYDVATGTFEAGPAPPQPGSGEVRVALLDGRVLFANPSDPTQPLQFYEAGYAVTRRATISSSPDVIHQPANITVTGTGFRGDSESSSGSFNSASTDFPMFELQRVENEQIVLTTSAGSWSETTFTTPTLSGLPIGHYRATMFVNGVPSAQRVIRIFDPLPVVNTLSQTSGPVGGGQSLTITGTGLTRGEVKFGGTTSTVLATTATSITLTTPPHDPGVVDLVVRTINGSTTVPAAYTYFIPPPVSTIATADSPNSVVIGWSAVAGATGYEIARSANGTDFTTIAGTTGLSQTDFFVDPDHAYLYKVRAKVGGTNGPYGATDLATTVMFSDDPIINGSTTIRAVHVTQLRTAVDAVRTLAGIGAGVYSGAVSAGGVISAVHLTDLRNNLAPARSALGLTAAPFTETITPGFTTVKALHFMEVRNGVK